MATEEEPVLRRALEIEKRENPGSVDEAQTLWSLMSLSARTGNLAAARDYGRRRYETLLHKLGPNHGATAVAAMRWAQYRSDLGETNEAVQQVLEGMPAARGAYPPPSFDLCTPTFIAAHVLNQAKRFEEAEAYARESLTIANEAHLPQVNRRTAESLFELGKALQGEKKYREANSTIETSAAMYDRLGPVWAKRTEEVRKAIRQGPVQSK